MAFALKMITYDFNVEDDNLESFIVSKGTDNTLF